MGFSASVKERANKHLFLSLVELSCSFTYPSGYTVTATEWYYWKWIWTKIPDKSTGRVLYLGNNDNDCTLRITDLREEDSTSYYFRFTTGHSWISGSQIVLSVTGTGTLVV
uniref:B-cell receptor CD22 first Ig-like domain-containing protein n=1 Tax=Esox lucius TaxID=8010 RepID=A0AAY5K214_ESOLU